MSLLRHLPGIGCCILLLSGCQSEDQQPVTIHLRDLSEAILYCRGLTEERLDDKPVISLDRLSTRVLKDQFAVFLNLHSHSGSGYVICRVEPDGRVINHRVEYRRS